MLAVVVAMPGVAFVPTASGSLRADTPGGDRLAEGQWELFLSARLDTISIQSGANGSSAASVYGDGSFKIGHDGDATGSYDLEGTIPASTVAGSAGGEADLALHAVHQPITGARDEVALSGDVALTGTAHVTVGSTSLNVPIDTSGPIGGSGDAKLVVEGGDCNEAWGDWTLDVTASSAAAGNDTTGRGYWYAYRILSLTTPEAMRFAQDVATFQTDVQHFSDAAVASATFDVGQLGSLLERADALAAEIPALAACSGLPPGGFYTSIMAGLVRELIASTVAEGTKVPTDALLFLAAAGYRTGAIGAGTDDSTAPDLELKLEAELGSRLDAAIAAHDVDTIIEIATEAALFGWTDLASRAASAL